MSIVLASPYKSTGSRPQMGVLWEGYECESIGVPHMPLTNTAIKKTKPNAKRFKLHDGRRLYLLVYPMALSTGG